MGDSSFDSLVRLITASAPRRGLLTSALAPAVAGIGAMWLRDAEDSVAKKKRKTKKCKKCEPKGLGEPCTSNEECCTNETNRRCALSFANETTLTCCGGADAACTIDDDCCGPSSCDEGRCSS